VKIVRHGCVVGGALEGHRSMNRISIRGVGTAAAAVAATALAVGAHVPAADAQETGSHASSASRASSLALDLMSTNSNTDIAFPAWIAGTGPSQTSTADLLLVHAARNGGLAASSALQARALAAAQVLAAQQKASDRASRINAVSRASRSVAVRPVVPGSIRALGQKMAAARGWTGAQWQCLDNVWTRESGWGTTAENPSGAYGIPQASPGSKMASAGADWRTNPATQITWGFSYISNTYGNPCAAWGFWQEHYWY
jgi:hypothetical protein